MKTKKNPRSRTRMTILVIAALLAVTTCVFSQGITIYQYRQVAPEKVDEFIKRETTYWSEIAKKALEKDNLQFWALLEKVGGYDLQNSSNFLFVNTYKDIDAAGEVWNTKTVFPNVSIDKMETNSISKVTSAFFLKDDSWEQATKAVPDKDFKYIIMIYHNTSDQANLMALEKKHWAPFIKAAMDKGQTTQVAWGNAAVLSPSGDNIKFNTVSYDLFPSLKEALNPTWDPKTVFPTEGLTEINKLELNRRGSAVYRIVKVVSKN
jgi:hypothetical protein